MWRRVRRRRHQLRQPGQQGKQPGLPNSAANQLGLCRQLKLKEVRHRIHIIPKSQSESPKRLNSKGRPEMCENMNITLKGPDCLSKNPKLNFKGTPEMCEAIEFTSNITKHVCRSLQGRHVLGKSYEQPRHHAPSPQPVHKSEGSCLQNCLELPH